MHIDDDVFRDVQNGTLSDSDFANLLLHEGMHGVIDPSTGNVYEHPNVTAPPYPIPFFVVHTGQRLCVNN